MSIVRTTANWSLLVLITGCALISTGCSKKKTTPADVTQTTPVPDNSSSTDTGDGNGDAPVDAYQEDPSLRDIFFTYDDHTLSEEARSVLSGNASHLREMGALRVMVEGHCDERGTVEYNLALGQRRADATRDYLVDLGVEASRVATIAYGEERPFETGHDESAWSQNRRAHFRVTNP
ncbi:MAG: peptidoglycan-associated lipoprotein Pal [Candidatus Eisenbacteria bacterium]|nr:peptidoglycan-associated lipoprotein Pal [Candidatus Eisenbacteria bacterium]